MNYDRPFLIGAIGLSGKITTEHVNFFLSASIASLTILALIPLVIKRWRSLNHPTPPSNED